MLKYNSEHPEQHVFMSSDLQQWTWEASIYKLNKDALDKVIDVEAGVEYKFNKVSYASQPQLGKMLNNKTETAYKLLISDLKLEVPDYVKEALEWVRK
jgi:hypothetical protein